MLPFNLQPMTDSHMEMLGCEICIDTEVLHKALMEWRGRRVGFFEKSLERIEELIEQKTAGDAVGKDDCALVDLKGLYHDVLEQMNGFIEDVFVDGKNSRQKHERMRHACDEMTCHKVGDTEFYPYKCCIGRCDGCPEMADNRGETNLTGHALQSTFHSTRFATAVILTAKFQLGLRV
jgi:hypothetical protein